MGVHSVQDYPAGTACRATQTPGVYLDNCAEPDTCQTHADVPRVDAAPPPPPERDPPSSAPDLSGSAAACAQNADPHLRKFVGLRCCRDRANRTPYTMRIGHQNGGSWGLTHAPMYEPACLTLRRGFLARPAECGYAVTTYLGPLEPETLADGDVVIS